MDRFIILLLFIVFSIQVAKTQIDYAFPPGDTSVCSGDIAIFIISVSPGMDSIRWQFSSDSLGPWDTLISGVSGDKTTMLRVIDIQFYNGKYFRAVSIDGGLLVDSSNSASLTVWDSPVPTIDPPSLTLCKGVKDTLDVGTEYMTYLWSTGSTVHFINVPSGSYSVTVTNDHGCIGSTAMVVNEYPITPPILFVPTNPKICIMGDTSEILGTQINYSQYLWGNDDNDITSTILVSDTGTIGLTVTDMNGCNAIGIVKVTYYPEPSPIIIPPLPQFCEGMSTNISVIEEYMGYEWSTHQHTQEINVNVPDEYTVTVTDSKGCKGVESIFVVENTNPEAIIKASQDPISLVEEQYIEFRDSSKNGSGILKHWEWDYGENALPDSMTFDTAYNKKFVKYERYGWKNVTLSISDDKGCVDINYLPEFFVVGNGPKVDISVDEVECVTDITKLKVTIEPSNSANSNLVLSDYIEWNYPMDEVKWDSIGLPVWVNSKKLEQCIFVTFYDPNESHTFTVKGFQIDVLTQDTTESVDSELVFSGLPFPGIDETLTKIPSFICEGVRDSIEIQISPQSEAYIVYKINGSQNFLDTALNGFLIVPIVGAFGSSVLSFEILSIELKQGCRNSFVNYKIGIPVRPLPILEIDNPGIVCVGSTKTINVSGAETYSWKLEGNEVSTDSFLLIPADEAQQLQYIVTGSTAGCSSDTVITVQVKEPPSPAFSGDTSVCIGQHVTYVCNSNEGIFSWKPENGQIQGPDNKSTVEVKWLESGSLKLIQEIGGCEDSISRAVIVGKEESPPYDTLIYLSGGGILLYPNPSLIPNLCYKWYKDNKLLQDTFQGCVVGANLPKSELERYSVQVYYCGQDTGCAQLITYRTIPEISEPTEFDILVVPNPNSGDFSINYNILDIGNYVQYIFNSSSQLVWKESKKLEEKEGSLNLSLPNSASGIYFIKLINSITGDYRVVPFSILK